MVALSFLVNGAITIEQGSGYLSFGAVGYQRTSTQGSSCPFEYISCSVVVSVNGESTGGAVVDTNRQQFPYD